MAERGCIRTGQCCQLLGIHVSPRRLRESYAAWVRGDYDDPEKAKEQGLGSLPGDIHLLYPMLAGRCVGKRDTSADPERPAWHYYYGPCRMLDFVLEGGVPVPTCAIHDNKPYMCRGYPFYADKSHLSDEGNPNPGFARGCGYNEDPEHGTTEALMRGSLQDLDPEEM